MLSLFSSSVLSLCGTLVVLVVWYGGMSPGPDFLILQLMVIQIEVSIQIILHIF